MKNLFKKKLIANLMQNITLRLVLTKALLSINKIDKFIWIHLTSNPTVTVIHSPKRNYFSSSWWGRTGTILHVDSLRGFRILKVKNMSVFPKRYLTMGKADQMSGNCVREKVSYRLDIIIFQYIFNTVSI